MNPAFGISVASCASSASLGYGLVPTGRSVRAPCVAVVGGVVPVPTVPVPAVPRVLVVVVVRPGPPDRLEPPDEPEPPEPPALDGRVVPVAPPGAGPPPPPWPVPPPVD